MNKYIKENVKYILRSYPFIQRYVRQVESLYKMDSEELMAYKEQRFLLIFRKAFQKSSFYHQLYTDAGIQIDDIQTIDDIVKLPIVTKEMIREHPEHLLTCPRWQVIAAHTSGTTGTPLTVYESWPSIWRERAYGNVYRDYCGFTRGKDRLISMRGHLDRNESKLYVDISRTLYLSSYTLNAVTITDYYEAVKEFTPKAIEGYPSSLFSFCLLLQKKGYTLEIPIIFTSSETLGYSQKIFIENILHGKIFDYYGNTERTVSLCECHDHSGYFEQPGYSISEYNNNYIISTSLISDAFPLIRYKVEDKILLTKSSAKHPLSPIANAVVGRSMEYIKGIDGTEFNAASLTYLAKAIPNIAFVQLIQKINGFVNINIIPRTYFSEMDLEKTKKVIDERIGPGNLDYKINVIKEDEILKNKNGKISLIIIEQ